MRWEEARGEEPGPKFLVEMLGLITLYAPSSHGDLLKLFSNGEGWREGEGGGGAGRGG